MRGRGLQVEEGMLQRTGAQGELRKGKGAGERKETVSHGEGRQVKQTVAGALCTGTGIPLKLARQGRRTFWMSALMLGASNACFCVASSYSTQPKDQMSDCGACGRGGWQQRGSV